MSNITKGKWNAFIDGDKTWKVNSGDVDAICDCVNTDQLQNKYNAKLIAAAPELLEALQWLTHHAAQHGGLKPDTIKSVCDAAIKKATA